MKTSTAPDTNVTINYNITNIRHQKLLPLLVVRMMIIQTDNIYVIRFLLAIYEFLANKPDGPQLKNKLQHSSDFKPIKLNLDMWIQ